MIELPEPKDVADIYEVYNRTGDDQWGPAKGIAALINAAVDFQEQYPGEKLSFGDMKSPFGGSVAFSGGKHHKGDRFQVDMRLLSNFGGSRKGNWNEINFSSEKSIALFNIMKKYGFNQVLLHEDAVRQILFRSNSIWYGIVYFPNFNNKYGTYIPYENSSIKIEIKLERRDIKIHDNHYHFQKFN